MPFFEAWPAFHIMEKLLTISPAAINRTLKKDRLRHGSVWVRFFVRQFESLPFPSKPCYPDRHQAASFGGCEALLQEEEA
jgi:hypothetical protein